MIKEICIYCQKPLDDSGGPVVYDPVIVGHEGKAHPACAADRIAELEAENEHLRGGGQPAEGVS